MNNKYQSKSRKKTPWDDNETLTESQAFISSVYVTHYDRSHMPLLESGESELINSYIPKHCPYCRVNCFHSFLHDGASHRLKCFINICFYFASILPSAILSLENGLCLEHVETSGYFDTAFLSVDAILTSTDE